MVGFGRVLRNVGGGLTTWGVTRWLGLLVVAVIILPILLFASNAWLSYRAQFVEAGSRLTRTADIVSEHALKVFETQELVVSQVMQLLSGLSDDDIRTQELAIHQHFKFLATNLHQVQDIRIIDKDGHALVSGLIYPVSRQVDVADREYFRVHKNGEVAPNVIYLSETHEERVTGLPFFLISKPRVASIVGSTPAQFEGIITISVEPKYLHDYYARVAAVGFSTLTLSRSDGKLLVRFPNPQTNIIGLPAGSPFLTAITQAPESGVYDSYSPIDQVWRVVGYRHVRGFPAYVTVGLDRAAIIAEWQATMASHLIFGIPATIGLITITLLALVRARKESAALSALQSETSHREAIEDQLRQSQKLEAVGQLTGGLAHDFNNLLTIIQGNLDTIERRIGASASDGHKLAQSIGKSLEMALQGTRSAAQLTYRLLAFSRRQALTPLKLDVNRLISGVSDLLRRTLGGRINIETVLAGDLWPTFADANQLESVLINLSLNARDAMPEGGRLTIETANAHLDETYAQQFTDVLPGQYVLLSVTDTGVGIPADLLHHVFEPFYTTKAVGEGSGLGLAMVHGFVKQSGGHVLIYSEAGHGTTIKIYLPRFSQSDQAAAAPAARSLETPTATRAKEGETIVLVEDNNGVREYARSALEDLGYIVIEATNGEEALAALEDATRVDLLFTDVVLPGMTGRELSDRALKHRPGLRVLFTTGYTRNSIIHNGQLDHDVQLISKPYTQQSLGRKIRQVLESRPNPDALEVSGGLIS